MMAWGVWMGIPEWLPTCSFLTSAMRASIHLFCVIFYIWFTKKKLKHQPPLEQYYSLGVGSYKKNTKA